MTWIAVLDQGRRKRLWIKESPVVRLVRKGVEIPRSHSGSSKRAWLGVLCKDVCVMTRRPPVRSWKSGGRAPTRPSGASAPLLRFSRLRPPTIKDSASG